MSTKYIIRIINLLNQTFHLQKDIEITIEINPGTVNEKDLREYYEAGINRLSIGLQTTNNKELKILRSEERRVGKE